MKINIRSIIISFVIVLVVTSVVVYFFLRVTENEVTVQRMNHFHEVMPNSERVITDKEAIKEFTYTVRFADKQPGMVDITDPDYQFTLGKSQYYLWASEQFGLGSLMKLPNTDTVYNIDKSKKNKLIDILNKEYETTTSQNGEFLIPEAERANLEAQVKELQREIEELKNQHADSNLPYIRPDFLKEEWDQVILETHEEEFVIDSTPIIEEFRNQFRGILETGNPYPGGHRRGEIPFTFHILTDGKQYTFRSLDHDFFMSEDGGTYYRSEEDYAQLAKALLSKPNGYPEEDLSSKLYNSGMMVGEKEFKVTIMDSFRIRGIASIFISMKKNEVKPQTLSVDYFEKFTFYYFGETYHMALYDEFIHLSDEQATINLWYKANEEDITNILMVLRAG
jgi:hypothetical protein